MLEATHLVAGGEGVPFKRTPKLLAGMGCCRYVLDVAWLHDSAQKRQVLDGLDYILCDSEVLHACTGTPLALFCSFVRSQVALFPIWFSYSLPCGECVGLCSLGHGRTYVLITMVVSWVDQ